jgi:hypothetical protein
MGAVRKMAVAALVCALTSCSQQMATPKSQALVDGELRVGMSRLDVEKTVGFPQRIERVGGTTFFFYTPRWYVPSYFTNAQNPVALANEKVVGLGKAYYDATVADPGKIANSN